MIFWPLPSFFPLASTLTFTFLLQDYGGRFCLIRRLILFGYSDKSTWYASCTFRCSWVNVKLFFLRSFGSICVGTLDLRVQLLGFFLFFTLFLISSSIFVSRRISISSSLSFSASSSFFLTKSLISPNVSGQKSM